MNKIYRIYNKLNQSMIQSKALNFGGTKCVKHEFTVCPQSLSCPQNMVSPNVYVRTMEMTKLAYALTLQFWDKHHSHPSICSHVHEILWELFRYTGSSKWLCITMLSKVLRLHMTRDLHCRGCPLVRGSLVGLQFGGLGDGIIAGVVVKVKRGE